MRNSNLDLARVAAILAIVLGHTMMIFWDFDPASPAWAVYNLMWILVRGTLMLFFMISGTLFMNRKKLDFRRHMRRTLHLLALFYLWSFLCSAIDARFLHYWTRDTAFLPLVLGGYFHLWFLPTMAMCYCALPLLHGLAHGDRDNVWRGSVLLFAIVTVRTTLGAIPGKPEWLEAALRPYDLYYFRYFVIMPIGWQLYERRLSKRALGILGAVTLAACLLFAWLNRRHAISVGAAVDTYYGDLTVTAGLMAAFLYSLFLRVPELPPRVGRLMQSLSACSFGVYLIHPIVIDALRSRHLDLTQYSALWLFPLCYLCFLLLPLALSALLLRIPGLRRLVS